MANHGAKVSKPGKDVKVTPSDANRKDFVLLDDKDVPRVDFKGYSNGNYTHGLGQIPFFFAFVVDDVTTPTYFEVRSPAVDTTTLYLPTKSYIIVLKPTS